MADYDFVFLLPEGGSYIGTTGITTTKNRLPNPGLGYTTLDPCGLGTFQGDVEIIACSGFTGKLTCDGDIKTFSNTDLDGTLNVDGSTTLNGSLSVVGISTFSNTTDSFSKDTGALIAEGGVGIEKNLNVGGNTIITGISTFGLNSSTNPVSNSQMSFELTNNTTLTIRVRGTDGTVRTATIALSV